ncbi:unnamed protein product [Coregonus sp. 'balchen']|nr:unnamed protein product [Coregonus sp. 'balchen']
MLGGPCVTSEQEMKTSYSLEEKHTQSALVRGRGGAPVRRKEEQREEGNKETLTREEDEARLRKEEDEFSELRSELSHSQLEVNEDGHSLDQDGASVSLPENHSTLVTADMDNCSDLNLELQRVLTGLESVLCGRKKSTCSLSVAEVDRHIEQLTTASEHCDLAIKTVEEIEGALGRDFYPSLSEERMHWEKELAGLREENESLTAMLCSKEEDLNRTKATMNAIREERDRLRRRVRELQTRLQSSQPAGLSSPGRLTPASRPINPSTGELSTSSSSNDIPVAKVSSNVAEHLAHSLQDCSNIQEIFQTLYSHGSAISENKIREFEVETERLNSRIEHLKSQNDLLTITLEECKGNAERMSMLVGKYESNATALRLALQYSEQSLVLGQFRAAGVGTVGEKSGEESITQILKRAHDCRKTAENAAKDLLGRLDDFSKEDEQRLKDYVQQLKNDRAAVKLTMLELESVHVDPLSLEVKPRGDTHRLDLENAVLMQELMAMKEEMAELKAQLYLLEKEKKAVELRLSTREAQEQAYLVHIEHLKAEVEEQQEQRRRSLSSTGSGSRDKSQAAKVSGQHTHAHTLAPNNHPTLASKIYTGCMAGASARSHESLKRLEAESQLCPLTALSPLFGVSLSLHRSLSRSLSISLSRSPLVGVYLSPISLSLPPLSCWPHSSSSPSPSYLVCLYIFGSWDEWCFSESPYTTVLKLRGPVTLKGWQLHTSTPLSESLLCEKESLYSTTKIIGDFLSLLGFSSGELSVCTLSCGPRGGATVCL